MKIVIFYGSSRKGNTHKAVSIFKKELLRFSEIEFVEYTLSKALPEFCTSCHNCFSKGEEYCPHYKYVKPIEEDIATADGLVFATPVYVLGTSAAMKNLFDHLGYRFLVHRPVFFNKKSILISTAAGAGFSGCRRTVKTNLKYWGALSPKTLNIRLLAPTWEEIKNKDQVEQKIRDSAAQFNKYLNEKSTERVTLFSKMIRVFLRSTIRTYPDNSPDKIYWQQNNWL